MWFSSNAQRIIELKPNETAQFVFTNSKKPSLRLTKTSSDGPPLEGVSFRLAKIEIDIQIGTLVVFQHDSAFFSGKKLHMMLFQVQNVVVHRSGFDQGIDSRITSVL